MKVISKLQAINFDGIIIENGTKDYDSKDIEFLKKNNTFFKQWTAQGYIKIVESKPEEKPAEKSVKKPVKKPVKKTTKKRS